MLTIIVLISLLMSVLLLLVIINLLNKRLWFLVCRRWRCPKPLLLTWTNRAVYHSLTKIRLMLLLCGTLCGARGFVRFRLIM